MSTSGPPRRARVQYGKASKRVKDRLNRDTNEMDVDTDEASPSHKVNESTKIREVQKHTPSKYDATKNSKKATSVSPERPHRALTRVEALPTKCMAFFICCWNQLLNLAS